jgi:hypothetical protein
MFVANIKRSVSWAPKAVPRVRMYVELGVAKTAGRSMSIARLLGESEKDCDGSAAGVKPYGDSLKLMSLTAANHEIGAY